MKIGTPRQYKWLKGIAISVILLNIIDGILTLMWVLSGQAAELNPLMGALINYHPALFMIMKTALVTSAITVLWYVRYKAVAVAAIAGAFICYYAILLYHLGAVGWIFAS